MGWYGGSYKNSPRGEKKCFLFDDLVDVILSTWQIRCEREYISLFDEAMGIFSPAGLMNPTQNRALLTHYEMIEFSVLREL